MVGSTHSPGIAQESFSFVALDDIPATSITIYFTENKFNKNLINFSGPEGIVKWTSTDGLDRGEVVVVTETASNLFSTNCASGNCGAVEITSGDWDLASTGQGIYAYQDSDGDPTNTVNNVYSVLYTGSSTSSGGNIPAIEDPSSIFLSAVVVDGFSALPAKRTEYDPTKRSIPVDQANFQNTSNWLHSEPTGGLSTVPFDDITIVTGGPNPTLSVSLAPSSVAEDSGTGLVYTFSLSEMVMGTPLTVNYTVGGTATLTTDYTVTGDSGFMSTEGTAVIAVGASSVDVTITPVVDATVETTETVELIIASGPGYIGGTQNNAIGSITNDDTSASDPLVAITGTSNSTTDGFSFVAAQDLPPGTVVYFTEDEFDNSTLLFSSGESVLQWTSPGTVFPKGDVVVVTETAPDTFALTCSGTGGATCGTLAVIVGGFALATQGETIYAYEDSDTDPTNGVSDIYAVLFTGTSATPGGTLPAIQDPTGIYLSALVVDGFPAASPLKTEYTPASRAIAVTEADFENPANYDHEFPYGTGLSTVPFLDLTIGNQPPIAICQDITLPLDAMGNANLTPDLVNNGSTDDGGTVFLSFETMSFPSDVSASSPTDELNVGTPTPYEASVFTVPTSGNYTFNMTSSTGNIGLLAIWDDVPVPNSGTFTTRPEFVQFAGWDSTGVLATGAGTDIFALVAGKTYYMSTFENTSGFGTFNTTIDMPIRTTAASTAFTCVNSGDVVAETLYVFDPSGNNSSCATTVTIGADTSAPTAVCADPTLLLDAMGNTILTPALLDGGSTDTCGTPFLAMETMSISGETTGANPTDELVAGFFFPYEASVFTVPTTGTYTFTGTGTMSGGGLFAMIWSDTPIPNSGLFSARPEFLALVQFDNYGTPLGVSSVALTANMTYYMSVGDYNAGLGTYSLGIDMPIITTAASTTYTCADIGTFPVTLYAFDAAGNIDSCVSTVTVDGVLTTYTGGAWDNGVPNLGSKAVIDDVLGTGGTSIEACSCDINNGAILIVNDGDYLLVNGDITVAPTGVISVDNTGSVVQIDDTATATNNGIINVRKETPIMAAKSFMVSGSPMTMETRAGVYGNSYIVRNHVTANFVPNPLVEVVSPGINNWADDNGNNWLNHTGLLNPGEGYMVFPQPDGSSSGTYQQNHTLGTLNNGVIDVNIGFNADQNSSPNMLSNPYASSIDAEVFFDNPQNSTIDVLYFWEHNTPLSITFPGYNVANFSMTDVSMYQEGVGGNPAASGGATPTQHVSSGQGFGVKPTGPGGTFAQFDNSMRVTGPNNTYRSNGPLVSRDRLWINVYNETYGLGSTTLIAFTDSTSDIYINSEDVNRIATPVSLYSDLDSEEELGINALGSFEVTDAVHLGFSTQVKETQNYRISIHDMDGINMLDATIYLIDALNGAVTNLSEGDYTFQSGEANYSKRFKVVFENGALGIEDNAISQISLYPNPTEGQLNIASPNAAINSITIFDLQGRKVATEIFNGNTNVQIDISDLNVAMYFVDINTDAGTVTKRLIKK